MSAEHTTACTCTPYPDVAAAEAELSAEEQARDLLERLGVTDAQTWSAGNVVELANLIAAEPFPDDEGLNPTPGQMWAWLLSLPPERRLAWLKRALHDVDVSARCSSRHHEETIKWQSERLRLLHRDLDTAQDTLVRRIHPHRPLHPGRCTRTAGDRPPPQPPPAPGHRRNHSAAHPHREPDRPPLPGRLDHHTGDPHGRGVPGPGRPVPKLHHLRRPAPERRMDRPHHRGPATHPITPPQEL